MISDERINLNYTRWIERLKKYDCYSERMIDELGEKVKDASFALQESSGAAYQGSMLDVVLNKLCMLAIHINDLGFEKHSYLKVNPRMLMRVLLLQHIAKAEMFVWQTNQWKSKNGYIFDFNSDLNTSLKCGERSIYLCMKYGITLSEEEYEAIRIIDKEETKTDNPYVSPLSLLIKTVNQMVSVELRQGYLKKQKKETKEE